MSKTFEELIREQPETEYPCSLDVRGCDCPQCDQLRFIVRLKGSVCTLEKLHEFVRAKTTSVDRYSYHDVVGDILSVVGMLDGSYLNM